MYCCAAISVWKNIQIFLSTEVSAHTVKHTHVSASRHAHPSTKSEVQARNSLSILPASFHYIQVSAAIHMVTMTRHKHATPTCSNVFEFMCVLLMRASHLNQRATSTTYSDPTCSKSPGSTGLYSRLKTQPRLDGTVFNDQKDFGLLKTVIWAIFTLE